MRRSVTPLGAVMLTLVMGLSGCALPGQNRQGATGVVGGPQAPAGAIAGAVDEQTGIQSATATARDLNKIPGIKGATVLLEKGTAYVGFFHIGDEPLHTPDKAQPSGRMVPLPYGNRGRSAESIRNGGASPQGPTDATLYQTYPKGDRRTGPSSTQTGHVDEQTKDAVTKLVKAQTHATTVKITARTGDVAILQGYAHHLETGGTLGPYLQRFHSHMNAMWKP